MEAGRGRTVGDRSQLFGAVDEESGEPKLTKTSFIPTCDMQKCFGVMYLCRPPALFSSFFYSQVKMNMENINKSLICSSVDAYTYMVWNIIHNPSLTSRDLSTECVEEKNECIFILIFFVIWKVVYIIHQSIHPFTPFSCVHFPLCYQPVKVSCLLNGDNAIVFYIIFHSQ